MDCEKLISLVEERKSLWDPRDGQYHNRDNNRNLWCEVATLLNSTRAIVKTKWQRLRDSYRRELSRNNQPTGSQSQGVSTWQYFNQMNFLEDTYGSRAMVGNIPDTRRDSGNDAVETEMDETEGEVDDRSSNDISSLHKRSRLAKDVCAELIDIKKGKLAHLQLLHQQGQHKNNKEDDEDYIFVLSLLPYARAIPKKKKLQARVRLTQAFMNEVGGEVDDNVNYDFERDSSSSQ
ncbi:uncharacterized protein LOC143218077 [Lasioglossum baleicum]|uniref:uncharacterized protein LOC143218077 n=1 Tax=Lasioglossum baleicum TaxID=434251 RepID=UPI003FCE6801